MTHLLFSELEIAPFFEMTPDLVCIAGKDGFFRKVNQSVVNKLGYTYEELMAQPIASFIHPDDRVITAQKRTELLQGMPLMNFYNRYVKKDGNAVWLNWTSIYFPDKEVVFAIAKDITEQKQIEAGILEKYSQFKSLATHFKNNLEQEKKLLATELHEELAQLASVIKMDIEWIRDNALVQSEPANKRVTHALGISDLLVNAIRKISYSISPNMLEDVGLDETLEWLCEEFSANGNISCRFQSNWEEQDLPHELKVDIFRICQEALNYIQQQSKAGEVTISITRQKNTVYLSIMDDGENFAPVNGLPPAALAGIRERVASIQGRFEIESITGKSSCITVMIDSSINDTAHKATTASNHI